MEQVRRDLETINNNGFLWTDIRKPSNENINQLAKDYHFHELNVEDCLSKVQIPKVDRYEDHVFIILHFPTTSEEEKSLPTYSQLSIFAGRNYLITIHHRDLKPLDDIFQLCKQSDEQRQNLMGKSSGYLLHSIIDALVDDLLQILKKIIDNLDDLEESVFNDRKSDVKTISLLRREITSLTRIVIRLRRTMSEVAKDIQKFAEVDLTPYFADVQDHIEKIFEELEESKEIVEIYKDTDFMLSTEKSNKILAILTIIFTLSIPTSTTATFYGMNINLPGSIAHPWTFLGEYSTMILILLASIISGLYMLWYFIHLGWIEIPRTRQQKF
ncbi:MAG TPA: magnesium transporter CorA family protein [Candidatus Nitrosopolaris sp.]|nr:magnesium transporter CorA family protein [Candidatus Nitrosopolaris sp.]